MEYSRYTESPAAELELYMYAAPIRVLIVDDNVDALELCSAILCANGCEVLPFSDPHAALAAAPAFRPQVVVTDVAMPEMLGIELVFKLIEMVPSCRIVFHTGERRLVETCRLTTALPQFTIVEKPARVADLLRAVMTPAKPQRTAVSVRVRIGGVSSAAG